MRLQRAAGQWRGTRATGLSGRAKGGFPRARAWDRLWQPVDELPPAFALRCIRAGSLRSALLFGPIALLFGLQSAWPARRLAALGARADSSTDCWVRSSGVPGWGGRRGGYAVIVASRRDSRPVTVHDGASGDRNSKPRRTQRTPTPTPAEKQAPAHAGESRVEGKANPPRRSLPGRVCGLSRLVPEQSLVPAQGMLSPAGPSARAHGHGAVRSRSPRGPTRPSRASA